MTYPPMPESEAEWRAHWALYQLTINQRDQAWRCIEALESRLAQLREARGAQFRALIE